MATNADYESLGWSDLVTRYPHSPEDLQLSMIDYLEDRFSNGWVCTGFDASGTLKFIFTKQTVLGP